MTKEYFNRMQAPNLENLKPEEEAKIWFERLLGNEIDLKTFKTGLDVLLQNKHKSDDVAYL